MKHAIALILSLALVPSALAQQQYQYREKMYVFSVDLTSFVSALDECKAATAQFTRQNNIEGINPNNGGWVKITAVDLSAGLVTEMPGEEIGEMLLCQDFQTYLPEGAEFPPLIPIYYEIRIDNTTFRATGGGTAMNSFDPAPLPGGGITYSPVGYPTPARAIANFGATVLPSIPGKRGGTLIETRMAGHSDDNEDGLSENLVYILRVLLPVNP